MTRPLLAALTSLVVPGMGQLWLGRAVPAASFFGLGLFVWLVLLTFVYLKQSGHGVLLLGAGAHVLAALDAAVGGLRRPRSRRQKEERYLP